jgi:hypothetical protein
MSGIVGASGNLGGIFFAMVFRFVPRPIGKAFWISGIMAMVSTTAVHPTSNPPLFQCLLLVHASVFRPMLTLLARCREKWADVSSF